MSVGRFQLDTKESLSIAGIDRAKQMRRTAMTLPVLLPLLQPSARLRVERSLQNFSIVRLRPIHDSCSLQESLSNGAQSKHLTAQRRNKAHDRRSRLLRNHAYRTVAGHAAEEVSAVKPGSYCLKRSETAAASTVACNQPIRIRIQRDHINSQYTGRRRGS